MQPNYSNPAQAIDLKSGSFSLTKPIRPFDRADLEHCRLADRCELNVQLQSLRSIGSLSEFKLSESKLSESNWRSGKYLIRVSPMQQGNSRDRLMLKPIGLRAGVARHASRFAYRVLQLTNAFRQQHGLKPLRWNDRLAAAAQQHSQNMATQDFFAHQGLDGASAQARGSASGYLGGIGENIAAGQPTPKAVVQAWINSPPHRVNLLDSRYREIGVGFFNNPSDRGLVNYRYYWAQNFGIPME